MYKALHKVSGPFKAWDMQASTPTDEIAAAAGPANFAANDFVIFNRLGAMAVRNVTSGSVASGDQEDGPPTRVNVFAATYETGKPFQGPVTVLLKEFPPGSRGVGLNELRLLSILQVRCCPGQMRHTDADLRCVPHQCGSSATKVDISSSVTIPRHQPQQEKHCSKQARHHDHQQRRVQGLPEEQDRWKAASADTSSTAMVPALGWFESAPSETWDDVVSTDRDSLWLVLKFEGLAPAQGFAKPMPLAEPQTGFRLFAAPQNLPVARRCRFLRRLFSGALSPLAPHANRCPAVCGAGKLASGAPLPVSSPPLLWCALSSGAPCKQASGRLRRRRPCRWRFLRRLFSGTPSCHRVI